MGYTDLVVAREGDTAVVTLNRPEKRNALRRETFEDLYGAFQELLTDPSVRAVVLTGAGDKAFSAGADLSAPPFAAEDTVEKTVGRVQTFLDWVEEAGTPVVAALNGDAFGGGCEVALACHFRVMDRRARIGLTESNLGIMPAAGGTQRLTRLIGVSKALGYMIFGKRIEAEEAFRLGLAHRLSDPGRAFEDAMALARTIAGRPPVSVRGIVTAAFHGLNRGLKAGLDAERDGIARCLSSQDSMEGISAFLEKRDPKWKGA